MAQSLTAMRWDGSPGHYEVWYVSLTDRASGVGAWIRYTMVAPDERSGKPATCSLWLMTMDPAQPRVGAHKLTLPAAELRADANPFRVRIGDAELTDHGMRGAFEDVSWDLRWQPGSPGAEHVHPLLQRARIAKTVLVLPHPDLAVEGTIDDGERTLELDGARGGVAHLWGSKHAASWAWLHCNDLEREDGTPCRGDWIDGVSVFVPRFGRELGPNTPVVARVGGHEMRSTSPWRVLRNESVFGLTSWRFVAQDGDRRLVAEVDARREDLVGVTYNDPDGDLAYCYNSEVASLRLAVYERRDRLWELTERLVAPGRAHFEYAQREPLPDVPLHLT